MLIFFGKDVPFYKYLQLVIFMNLKSIILLFPLLCLAIIVNADSNESLNYNFPEGISERNKFLTYLDSIDKYLYRDAQLTQTILNECESLIETTDELSNEDLLNYATQKIYIEQNNSDFLKCYRIIKDSEHLLEDESISEEIKDDYIYIRAFTFMSLEDWSSAQKAFNEMLEKGRLQKDTALIIKGLYSLGQLYGDEKEYDILIKCFAEIEELGKSFTIRPSTLILFDFELAENYVEMGDYKKAKQIINKGLIDLEVREMERLRPDFLLLQGKIALAQNNLTEAEKTFQVMNELALKSNDPYAIAANRLFHAELLGRQKKYTQSMELFDYLIEHTDSSLLQQQRNIYEKAHTVLFEMGDLSKAYLYLEKKNQIEKKIVEQSKKDQRAYYKVKLGSEEKENQQLALKILEEQNQKRFLYFLGAIFSLGLLILFIALHQKRKFSRTLQEEIDIQTKELEDANFQLNQKNQELYQFNKILSHDLREPLRSIVGFSFLAQKQNVQNEAVNEYMQMIEKGGKQLSRLIEDVSTFQDIDNHINKKPRQCDFDDLVFHVVKNLEGKYATKSFQVVYNNLPTFFVNNLVLEIVFKQLIDNSINFNQSQNPKVVIRYYQEDNQHCFEFKDNGIGIDAKYHTLIFDMFKRLNNRNDYEGSGLGLSIVKKMLEKINGNIVILQSAPNEGTTFLVSVPESKQTATKSVEKFEKVVIN